MKQLRQWLFSSESVAPGHPDKACDQISDLILDFFLERDPNAKVAAETMISDKFLAICGEFKTSQIIIDEAKITLPYRIRDLLNSLYPTPASGFDWVNAKKTFELKHQSMDINKGVEQDNVIIGAGDQGLMFGYACDETEEFMPLPISLANKMMERHYKLFLNKTFPIGADAKCQVTVKYEGRVPKSVEHIVFSTQHDPGIDVKKLKDFVIDNIICTTIPTHLLKNTQYLINPTGRFVIGGPQGDTGLTGRKIIVDTYGGSAPHGGGAFSGKDPTKVDRSAAYMARMIAKSIVNAGIATHCLVQLAYAIGRAKPISFMLDFQGTGLMNINESVVEQLIEESIDLTPAGLISYLNLCQPIYQKTATFGHFGRSLTEFEWEHSAVNKTTKLLEQLIEGLTFSLPK